MEASIRRIDGACRVIVADTGPGIPPKVLPHVFERFYRGTQGHPREGADLGFSIAQNIGTAHEARIRIDSLPGGDSG